MSTERDRLSDREHHKQHDFESHTRSLYLALKSHCVCHGGDAITANLRLSNCRTTGEIENSHDFTLFFLDHPHSFTSDPYCQWQEARIRVAHQSVNLQHAVSSCPAHAQDEESISSNEFCPLITNRAQCRLMLTVSEGTLKGTLVHQVRPTEVSKRFLLRSPSISLAELQKVTQLDAKMRLLLCYTLARAFWRLYGSYFVRKEWSKDSIHFMFEESSLYSKGVCINEPFLSGKFDDSAFSNTENKLRIHQFPEILSLGIILLEIELGINLEDRHKPECYSADGVLRVNARFITASEIFETEVKNNSDIFLPLRNAIEACLKPHRFCKCEWLLDPLRHALLQLVVIEPIEKMYTVSWEHPESTIVHPILIPTSADKHVRRHDRLSPLHPAIRLHDPYFAPWEKDSQPRLRLQQPSQSSEPLGSPVLHLGGTISSHTSATSSDVWFGYLDILNSVLRAKRHETGTPWRKSRIAILDTGVHEDLYEPDGLIKDYKDFVNNDDKKWKDNSGHGTKAVHLIKKVYDTADIYVGRVFENWKASDNTEALMAQAIHYAVDVWKADVIVMPSGFRSQHQEFLEAIEKANHAHVLVFTAAANWGNNTEIAFPGRLYTHGKLFCMFSTDADGRCLQSLNPSPLATARYSFAILGEDIVLNPEEPSIMGTSFSAIIAGALAGRILDFSRQSGISEHMRHRDRLSTIEGMSAVFSDMVRGAVDNGYHCITPWKILPDVSESSPVKRRVAQRQYIRETISRALDNLY